MVILERKVLKQDSHRFTRIRGKIPEQFFKFINPIFVRYSSCYVITLLNRPLQNTITDINILPISKLEHIKHINIDNKYHIYCNKYDIKDTLGELEGVDIDLLVSPFSVLHYKYVQNKLDHTVIVLAKKNLLSISVFDKGVAILSSNVAVTIIEDNSSAQEEESEESEERKDLDDIFGDDDFDTLDTDGDMDMDMDMDIDMNMDDLHASDDEFPSGNQSISTSSLDSLDINLSTVIKGVIEDFIKSYYEHGDYEFLSSIVIYNDELIDDSCVRYLKDELMMEIEIHDIKIIDILTEIAGDYE